MPPARSAVDRTSRFGRGVGLRGLPLRGLCSFPPRVRSAFLRPVCRVPMRFAIVTPDAGRPRESQAPIDRAPSPGGLACCTVLTVTAADHVVAVSLGGHEGERTVGAVRHVGSDSPPAGSDGDPAFDLAGASLEMRRPIDERPALNVSVMFLHAVRSHLHRHGKAGLVGVGGDGRPGFGGCEGAR